MAPAARLGWQDSEESSASGPDECVGPFPEHIWVHLRKSWRLSNREFEIVRAICANQELESIARVLDIPSEVVYGTLQRIYVKLRIGSRRELRWRTKMECVTLVAKSNTSYAGWANRSLTEHVCDPITSPDRFDTTIRIKPIAESSRRSSRNSPAVRYSSAGGAKT